MGASCLAPGSDLRFEPVYPAPIQHDPVRAEAFDRPAVGADAITQPVPVVDDLVGGATEEDETVRQPRRPVERDFAISTKPDRDGPRRLRQERSSVDPVETA